jgi:outer membrane protein
MTPAGPNMRPGTRWLTSLAMALASSLACAQQDAPPASPQQAPQPPPFTAPNPPTPSAPAAPGQQAPPTEQQPNVPPDAPLPGADSTSVNLRALRPLVAQPQQTPQPSSAIQSAQDTQARPRSEAPSPIATHVYNVIGAYHPAHVPDFPSGSVLDIGRMVRDGKLYLSLHDAIALAIANNLDVEVDRYNLLAADTDLLRARGGGNVRGIDYTIEQPPPGVSAATSPLLITATNTTGGSTNASVTDLSQVTQIGNNTQQMLTETGTIPMSPGPSIPLFDPQLFGETSYFRRSDTSSLLTTSTGGSTGSGSGGTSGTDTTSTAPLDYVSAGIDLQHGFSSGLQYELYVDNASQVLYGSNSQYDPFHSPSFSATLTQPLLRGLGPRVNLRYVHIAQVNQKVSRLVFEQQLLETVYGVSRLYYDLVSLGENIGVKEDALAAAQKLFDDDQAQVDEGALAPIELTRARALLSSSRLDLIQAQGEYRQQEVILKEQLLRRYGGPAEYFTTIVPTDHITVPDQPEVLDVSAMTEDALANRPDLAQASLQIKADELYVRGSRNGVKPIVNLYANVQTRGSSLIPPETLGSAGSGVAVPSAELTQGGLRLSTIYQGGVQVTLPLRNRIAQADAERDAIQLRQAQGRTLKLENDIRQQIENSSIAVENAHQAYAAAVESTNYQQQLLQAEIDKFAVGESTNYLVIQDQAYLAQARSTEVAARSDWMKARLSLDRSLGNLLEKNSIRLDEAIEDRAH